MVMDKKVIAQELVKLAKEVAGQDYSGIGQKAAKEVEGAIQNVIDQLKKDLKEKKVEKAGKTLFEKQGNYSEEEEAVSDVWTDYLDVVDNKMKELKKLISEIGSGE